MTTRLGLGVDIPKGNSSIVSPAALFSQAGSRGLFYDFSDYNTQFTDTAGTSRITGAGQSLALVLDKSQGQTLGSELFGGAFITSVAGGTATATENPSGTLNITGDGTNQARGDFSFSTVAGKTYRLTVTVSGSAASVVVGTSQGSNSIISGILLNPGNTSFVFVATSSTTWVRYFKTGAILSSLSATSVRELAGNHATQGTVGSQPLTVIRPLSVERRNLAIGSGDVGNNTYWASSTTNNGITATRAGSGFDTDGLPYADYTVVGTASADSIINTYDRVQSRIPALTGQAYAIGSILRRTAGAAPPAGCGINFAIIEETAPSTVLAVNSSTVTTLTTSDQTVTYSATLGNASTNQVCATARIFTLSGSTVNYTVRIKALQFELGPTRTTYQRVITANEWYQEGLQSYRGIQTDGVDDFLQTAAIDFSNSDKVTVVVGLRKLSDAARGVVVELGPSGAASFYVAAPNFAGANYVFNSGGSIANAATAQTNAAAAPNTSVLTGLGDIAGDSAILRQNGAQVGTSALDQGTGNYSNAIVYLFRRGGTSLPANVICTFMLVINRILTASELVQVEAWANARTGAY